MDRAWNLVRHFLVLEMCYKVLTRRWTWQLQYGTSLLCGLEDIRAGRHLR